MIRLAIIGGGPGGLMVAHLLRKRMKVPHLITLFEASARLGGKVQTAWFESAPVMYEAGAAELYDYSDTGQDPLREMVTELGLQARPMAGQAVVMNGAILKGYTDVLRHFGQRTCHALQAFSRRSRSLISPEEYYGSSWEQENQNPLSSRSWASFLSEVPDEAARRYIHVLVHSDVATEPLQTHAMYGLHNYLMNEPGYLGLYRIDGGMERLTQELSRRLIADVRIKHRVTRVEKTSRENYRLTWDHNGESSDEFDFVVVALPHQWLSAVQWGGDTLTRAMRRHHAHYDHAAHYLRVSLLFETPFWRDEVQGSYFVLDAFGGCCVYDESPCNDLPPFGVLGWLLAGEAALSLCNLSNSELVARVLDSLPASLSHGRSQLIEGKVHRWAGAVSGLPGGFPLHDPVSRHIPEPKEHPRLFVVGDYLFDSTLNGVLDSADLATDLVVKCVHGYAPPVPRAAVVSA